MIYNQLKKLMSLMQNPAAVFMLLFILIIPSYFVLLSPGFFSMHDDLQAFRLQQMDKCFHDFQIPCRWVPDAGYQYGYPEFNFYSPSVYYLGEVFHLIGFQFIDVVKILFILGFIFSALTMFIFLNSWLGKWPALVGALLYTYAPYRAVDVYVRGALSEFWAFVFFPLIFWSSCQFIKTEKIKYFIWMALSIGMLLITHSLMSMIFLPVSVIWMLTWIFLEKKWKILPKVILGAVMGVTLSAFFVFPMIMEKQYAHTESMLGGYFDYRQHFVDIKQLFISNYWGYGSSWLGPNDDISLSTGPVHAIAGMLALILAIYYFKRERKIAILTLILLTVDLFILFMTHQKSTPIWETLPILWYLQFPWRLLADSVFILSLLSGIVIYFLRRQRLGIILGVILILCVYILHGSFFHPQKWFNMTDREKFSGKLWETQLTVSIFDYLPIYSILPPTQKAPAYPEVMNGKADFISYKKGSNFQKGEVIVTETANLRLPLFDFPGMVVKIDGKEISHNHSDCRNQEFCLGLISFEVPEGRHQIEASLTDTLIRKLGNFLTFGSILILFFLIIKEHKKTKQNDNT